MSHIRAVDELITQIRTAAAADLHYLALFGVLALPDICAGLGATNGRTNVAKYQTWIRANVPTYAAEADLIYGLRCSLLHQGRALPHGGTFPLAFTLQQTRTGLHQLSTRMGDDQIGWLHLPLFIDEVTRGAEQWLSKHGDSDTVTRNLEKFARLRPEGLPPHVIGPVIA